MHIDVHLIRRHFEKQKAHRLPPDHLQPPVRLGQRMLNRPVLDPPPVDEQILRLPRRPALIGMPRVPPQPQLRLVPVHRDHPPPQFRPEQLLDPVPQVIHRRQFEHKLLVVPQSEMHPRMGQRNPRELLADMRELRRLRLQELPPHRRVQKQSPHVDLRPRRRPARPWFLDDPSLDLDLRPHLQLGRTRPQPERRHLRNRRQRLPPEPHRLHAEQIIRLGQLARRVRRDRQFDVFRVDPAAVVDDANQLRAPLLALDIDPRSPGIHGILEQLLHHARGTLDHLAGRDLVDQRRRQLPNPRGRLRVNARHQFPSGNKARPVGNPGLSRSGSNLHRIRRPNSKLHDARTWSRRAADRILAASCEPLSGTHRPF